VCSRKLPFCFSIVRNCLGLLLCSFSSAAMHVFGLSVISARLHYSIKYGSYLSLFCLCAPDVTVLLVY
jgi:hypothetical protein